MQTLNASGLLDDSEADMRIDQIGATIRKRCVAPGIAEPIWIPTDVNDLRR